MKIKCADGKVRQFCPAILAGAVLANKMRATRSVEACCEECGVEFGVHDLEVLRPMFRQHECSGGTGR